MTTKEDRHIDPTPGKYFHIMLNIAADDLDPYQYRLLGHYVRIGTCWQGVRTTARTTKMSVGKVVSTRDWLAENGWITVTPGADGDTFTVTIIDRMPENIQRFIDGQNNRCSPGEQGVHVVNGGVHQVNERRTLEEDHSKNTDSSASAEVDPAKPKSTKSRSPKHATPPIVKEETDPEPPGFAPPPTPKPVQPHVAIIDAWRGALNGDAPITSNPYGGQYGKVAVAIAAAEVTPDQVSAFTVATARDPFWQGKCIPLEYVAKNIKRWLRAKGQLNGSSNSTTNPSGIDQPDPAKPKYAAPNADRPVRPW